MLTSKYASMKAPEPTFAVPAVPPIQTDQLNKLVGQMQTIMQQVSNDKRHLEKYSKELRSIYEQMSLEEFTDKFFHYTRVYLSYEESNTKALLGLEFVALFCNTLGGDADGHMKDDSMMDDSTVDDSDQMHPLLIKSFVFIIESMQANKTSVRIMTCRLLNLLLKGIQENMLDDEWFSKFAAAVLDRMQDINTKVRVQAMLAAMRLQDPSSDQDDIVRALMFHADHDPVAMVRKAAVSSIGLSRVTIPIVLSRLRDADVNVRVSAFKSLSTCHLRSLKIAHRLAILHTGLNDSSPKVVKVVKEVILRKWLTDIGGEVELLNAVRLDFYEEDQRKFSGVAGHFIKELTSNRDVYDLKKPLCTNQGDFQLPDLSTLTVGFAMYWKHLALHFADGPDIDQILPELSKFLDFIKEYSKVTIQSITECETDTKLMQHDYFRTLDILLDMLKSFDTGDEVGREQMRKDMVDKLYNEPLQECHIQKIVVLLAKSVSNFQDWEAILIEVIGDLYEPVVKNSSPSTHVPNVVISQKTNEGTYEKSVLRLQICELREARDEAVTERDYVKAQELENRIIKLEQELESKHLSTLMQPLDPQNEVAIEDFDEKREVSDNPDQIVKSLMILKSLVDHEKNPIRPALKMLQENMLHALLASPHESILFWTVLCNGTICLMDLDLAQKYFPSIFILLFQLKTNKIIHNDKSLADIALMIVFDLFVIFGMDAFEITPKENNNLDVENMEQDENEESVQSLLENTVNEMDTTEVNEVQEMFIKKICTILDGKPCLTTECVAVKGLVQLYLTNRIASQKMLAKLIVHWFNPATHDRPIVVQMIGHMLEQMRNGYGDGIEALMKGVIIALRIIVDAPVDSSLQLVDTDSVIKFIVDLTKPGSTQNGSDLQNMVALCCCREMENDGNEELIKILAKILSKCELTTNTDIRKWIMKYRRNVTNKSTLRFLKIAYDNCTASAANTANATKHGNGANAINATKSVNTTKAATGTNADNDTSSDTATIVDDTDEHSQQSE